MKNNFPKIPLVLSLVFFSVSLLIFIYFFNQIKNNNQELLAKELEWRTEANKRAGIKTLDHSVKVIEADRKELDTHFAESSDIVPFLNTVDGLSVRSNTSAEITSVDPLEDHSGLNVGVTASGTFENLYKFLTLLENSAYEIEFTGVDMHKEIKSESTNTVPLKSTAPLIPKWNVAIKMKLLSFTQ